VDVGFLGWLAFQLPVCLALHLALAILAAAGLAAFLVAGIHWRWRIPRIRRRGAALALTAQLASRHMIARGL
jgi:hypothetical protein